MVLISKMSIFVIRLIDFSKCKRDYVLKNLPRIAAYPVCNCNKATVLATVLLRSNNSSNMNHVT